jgi:hypothetical protein
VYEAFRVGRNHAAAGLPLSFRRATERHDETRAASLDHLVGTGDERRRKLEAKCIGSLEIHDEIELRGLQYRQITRFLALEGTSSVNANLSIGVSNETLPAGYHPQPRPERRPCKK